MKDVHAEPPPSPPPGPFKQNTVKKQTNSNTACGMTKSFGHDPSARFEVEQGGERENCVVKTRNFKTMNHAALPKHSEHQNNIKCTKLVFSSANRHPANFASLHFTVCAPSIAANRFALQISGPSRIFEPAARLEKLMSSEVWRS